MMTTRQYSCRKAIASFLQLIPLHNGWWYRRPRMKYKIESTCTTDIGQIRKKTGLQFRYDLLHRCQIEVGQGQANQ